MHAYNQTLSVKSDKQAWLVCFAATLFFFYEFIQGNLFGSISLDVMQSFNIHVDKNSYLSSIYYASNVLFLFPAGMILDRFSTRKIILTAMSICIVGTFLFAGVTDYNLALVCRFMTGIGSAFCFLGCVRLTSRWFPADKMALATGLTVTMAMTGGMVAQYPMTKLLEYVGWRQAVFYDGILGVVILLFIARYLRDWPRGVQPKKEDTLGGLSFWQGLKRSYFNSQNILAALYTSLMNMPVAILGAMAGTLYLVQAHQLARSQAAIITSMLFVGTIIGGPFLGWLSDRIGKRRPPMIICSVLSLLVMLMVLFIPNLSVSSLISLFFLLGFFTSGQVISYPLVTENNSLSLTATAVSVVSILTQGGYVIYQNLFGQLLKHHWQGHMSQGLAIYSTITYQKALMILPYGFLIALLAGLLLKETYCRRSV